MAVGVLIDQVTLVHMLMAVLVSLMRVLVIMLGVVMIVLDMSMLVLGIVMRVIVRVRLRVSVLLLGHHFPSYADRIDRKL